MCDIFNRLILFDKILFILKQMKNGKATYSKIKENHRGNFKQDRTSDIQFDFYGAKQLPDETLEKL
ncbi:hypothetical protein BpHYR1_026332 [Brachionus plicatilis]|uniref:Uncharacterized protein n=1 Tax=Brachionus plicatilis TaxID=10195 RepID=A0A3M7QHQ3_BRAPC|nr:hypothetical protein BpHYR1_026332 [Brachionus plicatilis]